MLRHSVTRFSLLSISFYTPFQATQLIPRSYAANAGVKPVWSPGENRYAPEEALGLDAMPLGKANYFCETFTRYRLVLC